MNQGDIYWYTFRPPDKRRPVLILTRDSALPYLTDITVAPITSTIRGTPSEVILTPADGLANDRALNCYNLQTIPKASIGPFIAHLSPTRMYAVRLAIEFALGFDSLEEQGEP
jgi:mRNA interferase MazF